MVINLKETFFNGIKSEMKVSHIDTKVKCAVRDIDHLGTKFEEAVKKEYGSQFIKDASYIMGFMEDVEEPKDDEENKEENKEDTENDNKETNDDSNAENEELKESVKVQDLSKTMQFKSFSPKAQK